MRDGRFRLLVALVAVVVLGAPADAQEGPRGDGTLPADAQALIDSAFARRGPVPAGQSLAILLALQRFDLLREPGEVVDPTLDCPTPPERRRVLLPELPGESDCDLTAAGVQAYVADLLEAAEDCRDVAIARYVAALAAKADLAAQVDLLSVGAPPDDYASALPLIHEWSIEDDVVPSSPHAAYDGTDPFTSWLEELNRLAEAICAQDPFESIDDACARLNELLDDQGGHLVFEGQRALLHDALDTAIENALLRLSHVLEVHQYLMGSAQDFLAGFSEEAACPQRSGLAGFLLHLEAVHAFRRSLREGWALARELRRTPTSVHLWVGGRTVVLTVAPAHLVSLSRLRRGD